HQITARRTAMLTLRQLLKLDAITSVAMGVLLLVAGGWLATILAIPVALLTGAGALLLPVAAFMTFMATRTPVPAGGAVFIIFGNIAWVIASAALMVGPWIAPN